MSDTESIVFNVLTDVENPSVKEGASTRELEKKVRPPSEAFKKPPLHSMPTPASRRNNGRSSAASSVQFFVRTDAGEDDSDNTESLQFQTAEPSRAASLRALDVPSGTEGRPSGLALSSLRQANSETGDESIAFVLEEPQAKSGRGSRSCRGSTQSDSISFALATESAVDDGTTTGEKSLSFVLCSGEDASEKTAHATRDRKVSGKNSPKSPARASSKGVAERGITSTKAKSPVPTPTAAASKQVKQAKESELRDGSSGVPVKGPEKLSSQADAFTVYKVDGKHTLNERESGKPTEVAERAVTDFVANSPERVPLPFPHPIDSKLLRDASGIEQMVVEAQRYTEHWRRFNEIQRQELERLGSRITEVQEENFVGSKSVKRGRKGKKGKKNAPTCLADLFKIKQSCLRESDLPWHKALSNANAWSTQKQQRSGSGSPGVSRSKSPPKSRGKRVTIAEGTKRAQTHLTNVGKEVQREAESRFAELYGVAWPPPSDNNLFFLNGIRLTPKQRDEFYSAMDLYVMATTKVSMNICADCEGEGFVGREIDAKKKVRVTRTTLLRKAFTVMDVGRHGIISAVTLPSLQRLLSEERKMLQSTLSGNGVEECFITRSRGELEKFNGKVDPLRAVGGGQKDKIVSAIEKLRIYSLVLDVLFPLIGASGMLTLDFTSLGLLVFGTMSLPTEGASESFLKWREAAQRSFESLLKFPV
uniref:Uncharacterized protein TCIL3000_4_3590 n=1 Tax=Trypanosoma congolense (strain IL3000) TaxID=1068625 RepID=G0ULK2_TRYCI|nr:unnamed protein product [Trypanosoma congolense IL3000]